MYAKRKGHLHKVHQTILIGPVQCKNLNGGLSKEHDERSDQIFSQDVAQATIWCLPLGVKRSITGFGTQLLSFDAQDFRCICFVEKEKSEDLNPRIND